MSKVFILIIFSSIYLLTSCMQEGEEQKKNNSKSTNPIILFAGPSLTHGNLGGRNGADTICEISKPVTLSCPNQVIAFLSIDSEDEIRDMPENYNFNSSTAIILQNKTIVLDHFSKLTSGEFNPINLDVIKNGNLLVNTRFATGSNTDASLANNCNGWTVNDFTTFSHASEDRQDLHPSNSGQCNNGTESMPGISTVSLLCLCL